MSFTRQGLLFRAVEPSDLEMLMQHRNANLAGLRTPIPIMGMSEQAMWYDGLHKENMAFIASARNDGTVLWPEEIRSKSWDVGMLRISNIEWPQRSSGVTGTDVFTGWTGKGYGTRILRAGAEWLLQDWGMHRVTAEAAEFNVGAQRVIEKAGFKREGMKRGYLWRNGKFNDFYQYSILEGEL